ncbi:MAG: redox-sensitive transcriptional activator SoxR [Pseudomonadota bacterium]
MTIGQIAKRSGIAVSALRYYESQGLIRANRNRGGHRRFARAELRRVSFILIAQQFGLTLPQIRQIFSQLPEQRTPNARDWARISTKLKSLLNARIAKLERTRDSLDGCIGCGCLSLDKCALYNPDDRVAKRGSGPVITLQGPD